MLQFNLQAKVNAGQGAAIPRWFDKVVQFPRPPLRRAIMKWLNSSGGLYGSYEDMIPILEALQNVTTVVGIIPPEYAVSRCTFEVFWDPGPVAQRVFVGGGLIGGDPFGNEIS